MKNVDARFPSIVLHGSSFSAVVPLRRQPASAVNDDRTFTPRLTLPGLQSDA
ncbi:hypothetical protein NC651_033916 [Populus alba x Populus x berolinensis]|nr:hypothetical protein NC651_033916 [Populus alba x Populus x berolinensis]